MKVVAKSLKTVVAAGTLAMGSMMVAAPAVADLSASVGIASQYLFRGVTQDIGGGSAGVPAISGDLNYSSDTGLYGGIWTTSGVEEYDVYAGYAVEVGGVSIDASLWTYVTPNDANDNTGDVSEFVLALGVGGLSASVADNIAGSTGAFYYTLGYDFDRVSVLVGHAETASATSDDYTHLDLTFAATDNLSFTFSQVVDDRGVNNTVNDDLKVVASYALSFDL